MTTDSERDTLVADKTGVMSLLDDMGIRYRAKEGKRQRPTPCIPWLGFDADTCRGAVRTEERKVSEGPRLREEILGASPGSEMSARASLAFASFLNFLHWVIPGGFCDLRPGRGAANESGAMDLWRPGRSRSSAEARVPEQLSNDMLRRRKMLSARPTKKLQFGKDGGIVWRPRLLSLHKQAVLMGSDAVAAIYTDASSLRGLGAAFGDS